MPPHAVWRVVAQTPHSSRVPAPDDLPCVHPRLVEGGIAHDDRRVGRRGRRLCERARCRTDFGSLPVGRGSTRPTGRFRI
eukprot:2855839-Prymnesium_polylepis.1